MSIVCDIQQRHLVTAWNHTRLILPEKHDCAERRFREGEDNHGIAAADARAGILSRECVYAIRIDS